MTRGSEAGLQAKALFEMEAAAAARCTLDRELTTHQVHQMPADRQPQARAAVAPAGRIATLIALLVAITVTF